MPRVTITPQARRELSDLWLFIERNSGEQRANTVLRNIDQRIKLLAEQPGLGRTRDELVNGLRSLLVFPYLIFYFPSGDGVEVIHVIHGRQDIEAIFAAEDDED